ncbi:hypothetical protein AB0N81_04355 [Streptomyces sp. NPDC093510]|uniref:hypothetical protein n=1 Tax=Streptomyces sp. NPDC093510 TaxID=3155199 RepID=UPI00342979A3
MRIRTAVAATALAALTVLGGAGAAAADDDNGHYGIGNGEDVVTSVVENSEVEFGDLVMD